jgi:hypothetical protein
MIELIQEVAKIEEKIQSAVNSYNMGIVTKEEFIFLLNRLGFGTIDIIKIIDKFDLLDEFFTSSNDKIVPF